MSRENVELIRRLVEPWARGDFSAWLRSFRPDVLMSAYTPGQGVVTTRGRDRVLEYVAEFASQWDPYRVEVDEVVSLGDDTVLVSGRQIGVGRGSGIEVSDVAFVVNRLHDGQVAAVHWRIDRDEALEAVGLRE